MASPKPYASVSEESGEVQVLDSIEPVVTASSSTPSSSSARVMDSIEPLVPTVQSIFDESVAGPSGIASGSGDDEDEFVTMPVFVTLWCRPTGSSGRKRHHTSDEIRSMWNWFKIFSELDTHDQCVQFAEKRGLLSTEKTCTYHRKPMTLSRETGQLGTFSCRESSCWTQDVSRARGTLFEEAKSSLTVIFQIMYAFSQGLSYDQTRHELAREDEPDVSISTVTDWFHSCREAITIHEIRNQRTQGKIGGPNKVVQIGVSKFGKRKSNQRRQIEGPNSSIISDSHLVIGMIEDGNDDLRLEVCPDNEISADILVPLIKKHVAQGSIIHTDFRTPYMSLPDHGYTHKMINHRDSINKFVAPDGTHTQRIQSHWRGLKKHFRQGQNKQDFALWLGEYSWRRRISIDHLDPFEELLKAIKYLYSK